MLSSAYQQGGTSMMKAKLVAGLFALGLMGAGAAHAADPVKIRAAWVAPVSNWASIWLEKKDLAKHFGKSYVFEAVRFQGTPPMITAIANNELEVSNLAYRSEEHTSELQSLRHLVCRLLLEKKK